MPNEGYRDSCNEMPIPLVGSKITVESPTSDMKDKVINFTDKDEIGKVGSGRGSQVFRNEDLGNWIWDDGVIAIEVNVVLHGKKESVFEISTNKFSLHYNQ